MLFVGSGHPAIRATHHKTLEVTPDPDITERATCVVAVSVTGGPSAIAGDVRITIRAGDQSFALTARGNSSWRPGSSAVIRRSPLRLPGTFATHATAAASDLPRELVAALHDRHTDVTVEVEPLPGRLCAVLFAADPGQPDDPRLRAELAAADAVIAEDAGAAGLVAAAGTAGLVAAWAAAGPMAVTGRTLVVATEDLPGRSVVADLAGVEVETVGLPASLAAAAAFPARGPLLLMPSGAEAATALRDAPAGARVVVEVAADEVMAVLRRAAHEHRAEQAVLVRGAAAPVRVTTDVPVELWGSDPVQVCFGPRVAYDGLDGRAQAAVSALLAEQVPTRAAARVLAELTGWPRRTAYEYVVEQRKAQ